jgi:flagellar biosynthetic protein FliP
MEFGSDPRMGTHKDMDVNEELRMGRGCTTAVGRRGSWARRPRALLLVLGLAGVNLLLGGCGTGSGTGALPSVRVQVGGPEGGDSMSVGVQLLLLLTVLSLVPAILMMVTSFIRIAIVLSFARSAIGMPQLPPNQIILGLSLFLTVFVMAPVWTQINDTALQPFLANEISMNQAIDTGSAPLREFMLKQTRERDLALFISLGKLDQPNTPDDVPLYVIIPSFMISELKTAFQMGFLILLPFVVIDMVVSSALMSMGMMMLPPTTISLPFKVLLFVMADGWYLISRSLVTSFGA